MALFGFSLTVGQNLADGETVSHKPVAQPVSAHGMAATITGHSTTLSSQSSSFSTHATAVQTAANAVFALSGFSGLTGATAAQTGLNAAITAILADATSIGTTSASVAADASAQTAGVGDLNVSFDMSKVTTITQLKRALDTILLQARGNGSLKP